VADTDSLSRFISGAALLVSAASAAVSVLAYRRAAPRVKARLGTQVSTDGEKCTTVYKFVRLVNSGQSSIDIVRFGFQLDADADLHNLTGEFIEGPGLPFRLEAQHTTEWRLKLDDMKSLIDQANRHAGRIRAVATLGSGREIKSRQEKLKPWMQIVGHPGQRRRQRQAGASLSYEPANARADATVQKGHAGGEGHTGEEVQHKI
jgi:hypothetical protein